MNSDTADLLARFEGLAALIDEQDAKIRQQGADIQKLKTSARTTPSGIGTVKTDDGESIGSNEGTALLTRRNLLLKGTAGVAAATALTVYNTDAASAHARTTIVGAGTGNYGAAFAVADNDPDGSLPPGASNLGIAVAASTSPLGPSPVAQSAVLGVGSGARGVQGLSHGAHGVYGQSRDANGVRGEIPVTSASNTIAVYGLNNSSFAGPGPGAGGFGVYGLSAKGHGLVGATAAPGGAAVVGATNSVPGAWAGAFYGPVAISGDLIVFGAKSAAVTHPDSSYRQLYCVESPESWFEDFGTGQLVDGRAEISIEKGFGAVAEMDNYHVFLTAYDQAQLLHVTNRTAAGFTVEADPTLAAMKGRKQGELSGTFSWRVAAKRKDITGERLAVVTMLPEPVLPPIEDRTKTQRQPDRPDEI